MSTIKNGQNSLYCHLDKVINGPDASFQSLALGKKHVTNVCHTSHYYLAKFHFSSTEDSKETKISVNFHASDDITYFEICRLCKNTKI